MSLRFQSAAVPQKSGVRSQESGDLARFAGLWPKALLLGSCGVMGLVASSGLAMANFQVEQANTFTTPALTSTVGLQSGLNATLGVYTAGGGSYGGYAVSGNPSQTTINNMEAFANTGTSSVSGQTFTISKTTTSIIDPATAPGANDLPSNAPADAFYVNETGYVDVTTPGTYTFNLQADDAAEVYINGNNTAGGGASAVPTVAQDYNSPYEASASETFSTAGLYPIDIFMYQDGGGDKLAFYGFGSLTFYSAPIPEPATLGLMGLAGLGILLLPKRKRVG